MEWQSFKKFGKAPKAPAKSSFASTKNRFDEVVCAWKIVIEIFKRLEKENSKQGNVFLRKRQ
jgi:hypothetical protein